VAGRLVEVLPEDASANMDCDGGDTPAAGGMRAGEDLVAVHSSVSAWLSASRVKHMYRRVR